MALVIPASPIALDAAHWQPRRPILSGAVAADQPYGTRGVIGQANHAYAHRVHVLDSWSPWDADTRAGWSDGAGLLVVVTGDTPLELGADVSSVTLTADSEDATVSILTSEAQTASVTSVGRQVQSVTVPVVVQTGIAWYWRIRVTRRAAGVTGYLYRYTVSETILVAADFPS
jgi:hypothetical protein